MTREERKRALTLNKVSRIYCGSGISNKVLAIEVAAALLIDLMLMFASASDDELSMLLPFHCFVMTFFLGIMNSVASSLVGDNTFNSNSYARLAINGSATTGGFLCTLPFEARDIINLRLINFEKQFIASGVTTVFVHILLLIAENAGYTVHHGFGGIATLAFLASETLFMILTYVRKKIPSVIIGGASVILPYVSFMVMARFADNHQLSAVNAEKVEFMSIFSGISGIVIMIVLSAVIIFGGEYYLKRKGNVSWNLK